MEGCRLVAEVSAPGKVILHGEHSVVFGQTAVAAALGLRTTVRLEEALPSEEPALRLLLPVVGADESFPLRSVAELLGPPAAAHPWEEPESVDHDGQLRAVDALLAGRGLPDGPPAGRASTDALRACLYLLRGVWAGAEPRALVLRVRSDLPVGAGSGSSAALAVALAGALVLLRRRAGGARSLAAGDERLVSAWAYNCERILHGTPSGVDNETSAFGGVLRYRRGEGARALRPALALRVLLVDTRVARRTAALAAQVAARRQRAPRAVACVLEACGHVADAAADLLERPLAAGDDSEARYPRLAELWEMNHGLLAALGVSHPALEDVRRRAVVRGLPAKLTGAGGGGCALVLAPPADQHAAPLAELAGELRAAGYGVHEAALGGPGLLVHE